MDIQNPKKKVIFRPAFIYLSVGIMFISILGLRDVIITTTLISITGVDELSQYLLPFYWLGLILSVAFLGVYFFNNPIQIKLSVTFIDVGVWILFITPFLFLVVTRRLFLDFWLDELISIVRHIQPSVRNSILSYPAPNNHVFSNLVSAVYIQLIGHRELLEIFKHPVILRLPYMFSGLLSILVLGYLAHTYLGKWAGRIVVTLLCTTIPFLNFITQVRGYSFTFLFSSLITLLILVYKENQVRWKAVFVGGLSCLLFYTIPSNVYYLLALCLFLALDGLIQWGKERACLISLKQDEYIFINPQITLVLMMVVGLAIGGLFYAPVVQKIINNKYVVSLGFLNGTVFKNTFLNSIEYFVSNREWIFFLAGIGVIYAWVKAIKEKDQTILTLVHLSSFTFLLPYVFSFIRGDQPFERTFLVVLPSFILLATVGLHSIAKIIQGIFTEHPLVKPVIITSLLLVANGIFVSTYQQINKEIFTNLAEQKFDYVKYDDKRIWASHFLEHYQILPLIQTIQDAEDQSLVLLDVDNTRYEWVMTTYLEVFGISYQFLHKPLASTVPEALLIMSYPARSIDMLKELYPKSECRPLVDELSIYRVMHCQLYIFP